ncbi:hypothetical protein D9M70_638620 [compost metagenome]
MVKANAALEGSGARRVGDGGFVREKHGAGVQQALAILAPDQPAQPRRPGLGERQLLALRADKQLMGGRIAGKARSLLNA